MANGPRVWVTRTLPGAQATADRLRAMGFDPVVRPLLEVRALPDAMAQAPDPATLACIALTSPNTLDAMGKAARPYLDLPAFAVGDATARAAQAAGFKDVRSASGDIHDLARLISACAPSGTVFAPGAAIPAGDLPVLLPDRTVIRLPLYATQETDAAIPEGIRFALIHSPRAGAILAAKLAQTPAAALNIIAISPAAARPLEGLPDVRICIAEHPDEEAMLNALGNSAEAV
ncbi:uroporphyrinogen-III synthase [uncultured Brevundimonas sp.]|uniref:uroporphyrinogen-III synthase n=1 Tax=uncultured Brevundimonas sp. TaxID=213418 RepID=UPI002610D447|nr:uroporphyrinogen-III synthase [uncultured Brevundimonas sp.]